MGGGENKRRKNKTQGKNKRKMNKRWGRTKKRKKSKGEWQ
jgi:hypothetical protein